MDFRLLTSEAVPLTPALAQEFCTLQPSPTERDLNRHRMNHLREKAEQGKLVTFHWAKAKFQGQWIRVNGQHSSALLCSLDGDFPSGLYAHVDSYEVDTIEGLTDLFRQFDDRVSSRKPKDVAGAYQNCYPDLQDVDKSIGKLGIDGIGWYRRFVEETPGGRGDDQYKLFEVQETHGFLHWLAEIFSIKTPELRDKAVVGAMYATFIANEPEARSFWHAVARGGPAYEENAPATILDEWLKNVREEHEKVTPGRYYLACIYAWNAAREGKTLRAIKVDPKKTWLTPHAD
jgi:hypothetical protein